jgi:Lipocalin-like domain
MQASKLLFAAALAATCVLVGGIVAAQQGGRSAPSIVGVWRSAEVTTTGDNARTNTSPQPGFRIFTQRHYSMTAVTADKPRPELPPLGKATDKEIAAAFGPFIGEAGTYEIKGNEIHQRPIAAKVPNFMRSANVVVGRFKLEGDTLWITRKSDQDGPTKNPITVKWTRVE